jgi:uncharacterized protein YbaR (Trm112 family)
MHTYLIEMLECPVCHGELDWAITQGNEKRIETAEARCPSCAATYPVREGIGLFLTPDLPRNDLWEQVDSQLIQYLRERPELERRLMEGSVGELGPADLFYRALVLDERGDYEEAKAVEEMANAGLYTPEHQSCWKSQYNYVIERLSSSDGPIVDLASGRCYFVELLAGSVQRAIVATDFSPRVLRRDRRWLEFFGLYDQVSLLAFDARRTPFRDRAVGTLTTNLGLPNIEEPGELLEELRRIVCGTSLSISHFYPKGDEINTAALREAGLHSLLSRGTALEVFSSAGWEVEVANVCFGKTRPTPTSEVLEGARVDVFPIAETTLEWCVLVAH